MGKAKNKVIWKPEALKSLQDIYDNIWNRSPQNADNFINELIDFGDTLDRFPLK